MFSRIAVSFSLALLGLYGLTAPAFAARGPDATNVMLGTAATAIIAMTVLLGLYSLKWLAGLAEPEPAPPRGPDYHEPSLPADGHGAAAAGHH